MESDKGRIGASFAEFLDEQGVREEVEGQAVKELIAEQISAAMKQEGLSKVAMAEGVAMSRLISAATWSWVDSALLSASASSVSSGIELRMAYDSLLATS